MLQEQGTIMKIIGLCALALIAGCATAEHPGYSDADIRSCKAAMVVARAGTFLLNVALLPTGLFWSTDTSPDAQVSNCLARPRDPE